MEKEEETKNKKYSICKISRGIRSFVQKPSTHYFSSGAISKGVREVHELFSQFTADIIKLDVRFTR
ncbi:MAG: hypothetical protein C5B52_15140 [Bacteroidetes bacterium]|nr:MAG: hypothetical protein C5B52_15140 [Bacteroidota bacterium]